MSLPAGLMFVIILNLLLSHKAKGQVHVPKLSPGAVQFSSVLKVALNMDFTQNLFLFQFECNRFPPLFGEVTKPIGREEVGCREVITLRVRGSLTYSQNHLC